MSDLKSKLELEFHEEMISIYYKSGKTTGYWPNRFLQKVKRVGGLRAPRHNFMIPLWQRFDARRNWLLIRAKQVLPGLVDTFIGLPSVCRIAY